MGFMQCNRVKTEIKCMIFNLMDFDAIRIFLGFFMQCNMVKITFKWYAETVDGLTCK